jgi:hypothetical protein
MPYTFMLWGALKQQLAQRLSITLTATSFWTDTELGLILAEALRTYGSITQFWKERGVFNTVAGTPFYDLTLQLPALLGQTLTDRDMILQLQYALMENKGISSQSSWLGTEQFTLDDLTQALQRRRNQLLVETGIMLTNSQPAVPPSPIGRVPLDQSVIDVRWASWVGLDDDGDPVYYRLQRSDEFALNAFTRGWAQNASRPTEYSVAVTPPVSLQLAPPPNDVGSLDMLSVNAGANFDPANSATRLGIPDDLAWVLKWGALADLFARAGLSQDLLRARYCEMRWRQGVEIARMQSPLMNAQIQGSEIQISSLEDLERFDTTYWRNTSDQPTKVGVCGYNMIALSKVPDAVYSVTGDVARKAPIPVNDGEYVQMSKEELDVILDYAEHVAVSKQGGDTLTNSLPLMNNFYRMASIRNQRMRANAAFFDALGDRAIRPKEQHPRRSPRETQDVQEVTQ